MIVLCNEERIIKISLNQKGICFNEGALKLRDFDNISK